MDTMIEPAAFEDLVRARAYALWESEGRPQGRDAEHWRRSQEEFMRLTCVRDAVPCAAPRIEANAADVPVPAAKPRGKKKSAKKA